jgi:hypothetical protein
MATPTPHDRSVPLRAPTGVGFIGRHGHARCSGTPAALARASAHLLATCNVGPHLTYFWEPRWLLHLRRSPSTTSLILATHRSCEFEQAATTFNPSRSGRFCLNAQKVSPARAPSLSITAGMKLVGRLLHAFAFAAHVPTIAASAAASCAITVGVAGSNCGTSGCLSTDRDSSVG